MFRYNSTDQYFFKFVSSILNIVFLQVFPASQLVKSNIAQREKYFIYERKKMICFPRLNGKTTGKLFSYEQPFQKKKKMATVGVYSLADNVASRGQTSWSKAWDGEELKVELETSQSFKKIDPICMCHLL